MTISITHIPQIILEGCQNLKKTYTDEKTRESLINLHALLVLFILEKYCTHRQLPIEKKALIQHYFCFKRDFF